MPESSSVDATPQHCGDHLRGEVVVADLAGGVVHACAAEGRVHQDAGAESADDAADAVDAEHVESS